MYVDVCAFVCRMSAFAGVADCVAGMLCFFVSCVLFCGAFSIVGMEFLHARCYRIDIT